MQPALVLPALALALTSLANLAIGSPFHLRNANVTFIHMGTLGGAVLLKNGKETSCELAVIDTRAAFVSANCLDFSNGKVDKSTTYEAFVNLGDGGQPSKYRIGSNINVHPSFNPDTLANNVAVVQYNDDDKASLINTIPADSSDWSSISFVRKSPSSGRAPVVADPTQEGSGCQDSSAIYSANTNAFFCTSSTTHDGNNCIVPYGSVVANINNEPYSAALFSHVAVVGDSLCGPSQQYSYYTLLSNYVGFAVGVLNRPLWTLAKYKPVEVKDKTSFSMQPAKSKPSKGITIFGGDVYTRKSPSPSTDSPSPSQTTGSGSGSGSGSNNGSGSGSGNGSGSGSGSDNGAGHGSDSGSQNPGSNGNKPSGSGHSDPNGKPADKPANSGANAPGFKPTGGSDGSNSELPAADELNSEPASRLHSASSPNGSSRVASVGYAAVIIGMLGFAA
ncbi:hypothetical protein GGI12_001991 [Dipsacomyces acuminosporus]|nr:hypothetical protein GGI12_001991 [Dipsacomyces acuminosporus]